VCPNCSGFAVWENQLDISKNALEGARPAAITQKGRYLRKPENAISALLPLVGAVLTAAALAAYFALPIFAEASLGGSPWSVASFLRDGLTYSLGAALAAFLITMIGYFVLKDLDDLAIGWVRAIYVLVAIASISILAMTLDKRNSLPHLRGTVISVDSTETPEPVPASILLPTFDEKLSPHRVCGTPIAIDEDRRVIITFWKAAELNSQPPEKVWVHTMAGDEWHAPVTAQLEVDTQSYLLVVEEGSTLTPSFGIAEFPRSVIIGDRLAVPGRSKRRPSETGVVLARRWTEIQGRRNLVLETSLPYRRGDEGTGVYLDTDRGSIVGIVVGHDAKKGTSQVLVLNDEASQISGFRVDTTM
jgi:hypothetical protein